ncbi:MAG: sulfite reductase subunit alpha [Verrucomicrobia bacterium]|nr:MAG: sulfite reductase subunit alpha [Verrucomicrobiota bacterium]
MAFSFQLPPDAPFTPEQRAWLGDFLSKALAQGMQAASAPAAVASVPVTVLFGSQTGTAEGLAKKLAKTLGKGNFLPEIQDMGSYDRQRLAQERNLLIITSTYGDGEPPDSAIELHRWLMSDQAPKLNQLQFSVLALGDTSYPDFCKCGVEFDTRLAALGGQRIADRVDVDVDPDEPFARWSAAVIAQLAPAAALATSYVPAADAEETGYSKANPFPAKVVENSNLNGPGEKQTHHVAFSLADSGLEYEVGDALGVYPQNPLNVVKEIIENLPFKPSDVPIPSGGQASLEEALLYHYDIGTLNKSIIQKWQAKSGSPFLRSLVQADDKKAWDDFCWGRDLIDLVIDHPADFGDAEEFVSILKKLQPRLYSIASSPRAHPSEVHLCVGIVRYHTHGRARGGICSTFLADRLNDASPPRVFVHTNPAFRLPSDLSKPLIMVGPGTGIAPFRAFLEERKATNASGENWLFFGNPYRATDYLYEDELTGYLKDGTLAQLDLAWSRDQKEKIYVQQLMIQQGQRLWEWLNNGASFYVCGDASRMAKDVDLALHQVIAEHGKMSADEASAFVTQLKKDKRYQRDVY